MKNNMTTKLRESDYLKFCRICMCKIQDDIEASIFLAYKDMQRTLHGISRLPEKDILKTEIKDSIKSWIIGLSKISDQNSFDRSHKELTETIISIAKKYGYDDFTVGQAQKWINMSLKYLSVFNHSQCANVYQYFHIPLDSYILEAIIGPDYLQKVGAWSRISDYDIYLSIQRDFRNKYPNEIPLDVEFNIWCNAITRGKRFVP